MSIKDAWNALIGKSHSSENNPNQNEVLPPIASDAFPVIQIQPDQLAAYNKIPLASLASLGAAFAQLPESARTVMQTVTKNIATKETLFVGINVKGTPGYLNMGPNGTVGNVMQVNAQGRHVIAGRLRFKPIDQLPVEETTSTVMPIDPMLMVVAIALMTIEQKLDSIQKSVEEVLQFLKLEKQSRLRGNLNMLTEILDDYKLNCKDKQFCLSRSQAVLAITKDAHEDILFYQEQIACELQKQKTLHGAKDSQLLLDAVSYQFAEYQLACHLYAFSTFLDIMLRGISEKTVIDSAIEKMTTLTSRYTILYTDCHSQIAKYQHSSIEAQIVGGIGVATKGLGKAIASVPVLRNGPVDEALINVGNSIGKFNNDSLQRKLQFFEGFEENRMTPFIDNLQSVNLLCNTENAIITDGANLYVLQAA